MNKRIWFGKFLFWTFLFVQNSLSFTQWQRQQQRRPLSTRNEKNHLLPDEPNKIPLVLVDSTTVKVHSEAPLYIKTKRSLYEILQAPANSSKIELKYQYIQLARETHPDALIGIRNRTEAAAMFSEIAEAWKILSNTKDRRRYDRLLQAEALAENIGDMANMVSQQAGPPMKKIFQTMTVPFLRRTAVTAAASLSAVAEDLASTNGTQLDFGRAAWKGIKAGEAAGRIVDGMELLEKSQELEVRALDETERAMEVQSRLMDVIDKRINLAIRIPNSSLSSYDALKLLDGLNIVDSVSIFEMIRLKHTILHEVKQLQQVEAEYAIKAGQQENSTRLLTQKTDALQQAELEAQEAVQLESSARQALELAVKKVADTKQLVHDLKQARNAEEITHRKVTAEVHRITRPLAHRQEKVRNALRRKQDAVRLEKAKQQGIVIETDYEEKEGMMPSIQGLGAADLEKLKREEILLKAECFRLDEQTSRLLSRAAKLRVLAKGQESQTQSIQWKQNRDDTNVISVTPS